MYTRWLWNVIQTLYGLHLLTLSLKANCWENKVIANKYLSIEKMSISKISRIIE